MKFVLDNEDDDDVVIDVGAGVNIGVGSVGDDVAPHGLRLFRCHYRGIGSISVVTIIVAAVVIAAGAPLSLLASLPFSLLLHGHCHLVA